MSKPFLLIATIRLTIHGGVEEAIGYIGRGLIERGWRVAVFAPVLGVEAERLARDMEIVSGLANLDTTPDLIHGLQHTALVPCLIRFPDTPAIHICHSADPVSWADRVVNFERIRRYAAVDEACRDRTVREAGIAHERVALLPNAVDLDRFKPRAPLPARPQRALIVANRRSEHVAPIQEACRAAGLQTEVVGNAVDRETFTIEANMSRADIVFGAARIALEAMAAGCAVVVADARGFAGMAKASQFEKWRARNFGLSLFNGETTQQAVANALTQYDAEDAAALSRRVRETCGIEDAIDRIETLSLATIDDHRIAKPIDRGREARDLAAYLSEWLPSGPQKSPFFGQIRLWQKRAGQWRGLFEKLAAGLAARGIAVKPPGGGDDQMP